MKNNVVYLTIQSLILGCGYDTEYYNKMNKEKVLIDSSFCRGVSTVQNVDKIDENLIPVLNN